MKNTFFLMSAAALLAAGCASHGRRELPPPSSTKAVGVFDYSRSLDRNDDGLISTDEWIAAGGSDGRIRHTTPSQEADYLKVRPHLPISDLMVRVADIGEEPMTPVEFRAPAGARFAHVQF